MEQGDESIVKTPKQLEKEAKKLAKLEKFKQKQSKVENKKDDISEVSFKYDYHNNSYFVIYDYFLTQFSVNSTF